MKDGRRNETTNFGTQSLSCERRDSSRRPVLGASTATPPGSLIPTCQDILTLRLSPAGWLSNPAIRTLNQIVSPGRNSWDAGSSGPSSYWCTARRSNASLDAAGTALAVNRRINGIIQRRATTTTIVGCPAPLFLKCPAWLFQDVRIDR